MAKPSTSATINTGTAFGAALTDAWLINEGSGTTVTSLGGAIVGTFASGGSGNPAWGTDGADAIITTASNFDAYVDLGADITMTGAFTVVVAFKRSSDTDGVVIGKTASSYMLYVDPTNIYVQNETPVYGNVAHGGITNGTLYQIILSRTGSTITVYWNGSSLGPMTLAANVTVASFMNSIGGGGNGLQGILHYVFVANGYAVDGTEAAAINSNPYQYFSEPGGPSNWGRMLGGELNRLVRRV